MELVKQNQKRETAEEDDQGKQEVAVAQYSFNRLDEAHAGISLVCVIDKVLPRDFTFVQAALSMRTMKQF
jgi:hypothetical protein